LSGPFGRDPWLFGLFSSLGGAGLSLPARVDPLEEIPGAGHQDERDPKPEEDHPQEPNKVRKSNMVSPPDEHTRHYAVPLGIA
jgi:hypothetical protein